MFQISVAVKARMCFKNLIADWCFRLFFDYQKVFHKIQHEKMMEVLRKREWMIKICGLSETFTEIIQLLLKSM